MATGELRVAVVGTGHLGRFHAEIWAAQARARLVALCDQDAARAGALAERLGAEVVGDPRHLIGRVDAVSVATPADRHGLVAIPLLEAGIACLVEKPLAHHSSEAAEIVAAAERGRALLAVGHSERFQPPVEWCLQRALEPRWAAFERATPSGPRGREVSAVHDLMVHDIDLALALFRSEPVAAELLAPSPPGSDRIHARLHFPGGGRAELLADRACADPKRGIEIEAALGRVQIDLVRTALRLTAPGAPSQDLTFPAAPRPLQAELADFAAACLAGQAPRVSGAAGLLAVRWADRIESLRTGS
jgi:predicted dehydrogenase